MGARAALLTLEAGHLRWIQAACVRLSLPGCLPVVAAALLLGTVGIALGWWVALPAHLPGDELYGLERVLELTLRTLAGFAQAPDAPTQGTLTVVGMWLVVAGAVCLAVGAATADAKSGRTPIWASIVLDMV